jgi:hypothetical protein
VNTAIADSARNRPEWAAPALGVERSPLEEMMEAYVRDQLRSGIKPERIPEVAERGFRSAAQAKGYLDTDLTASEVEAAEAVSPTRDQGDVIAIVLMMRKGVSPDAAAQWSRTGLSPDEVKKWIETTLPMEDCLRWQVAGVLPEQAVKRSAAGLHPPAAPSGGH